MTSDQNCLYPGFMQSHGSNTIIHSLQEFIKFVDPEEKSDPVEELFRKFDKGVFINIDSWE